MSRRHPDQLLKPPQLASFNRDEHQLVSRLHPVIELFTLSKVVPSRRAKKTHFNYLNMTLSSWSLITVGKKTDCYIESFASWFFPLVTGQTSTTRTDAACVKDPNIPIEAALHSLREENLPLSCQELWPQIWLYWPSTQQTDAMHARGPGLIRPIGQHHPNKTKKKQRWNSVMSKPPPLVLGCA